MPYFLQSFDTQSVPPCLEERRKGNLLSIGEAGSDGEGEDKCCSEKKRKEGDGVCPGKTC
jgi:hypothetical protein